MSEARPSPDLAEATAHGLRWISLSRVATEVLLLFSMVALAHLIAPAAFGQVAIALIFQELALGIPAEGVGSALIQRGEVTRAHLEACGAATVLAAAALTLITLAIASLVIAPLFGAPTADLVRLSTPLFLLASLSTVPVAMLRRRLAFRQLAIIEISSSATRGLVALGLAAVVGLQGSALVLGGLAAGLVGTSIACLSAPAPPPRLRRQALRDISGYGVPASLAAISWTGFRNGDYAVLNAKLGAVAAGQYWRAYTLAVDYQSKIAQVMYTIAFPVLSRAATDEERFALRRRMVRLLTIAIFPLLTTLAVAAPVLIPWLLGPQWRPAIVPTQILCIGGAITVVTNAVGTLLMATGRARALLGFGVSHFVVYIGSVVLVAHLGLTAVAIDAVAVHGAFLVIAYMIMLNGQSESALRGFWRDAGAALTSCAVMAAATWSVAFIAEGASLPPAVTLCAIGLAGAGSYLAMLRSCFRPSWTDLRAMIRRIGPMDGVRIRVVGGRKKARALFVGR